MIQINCNVSGIPTDRPSIRTDTGGQVYPADPVDGRVTFSLPDVTGGANLRWADQDVRFTLPGSGAWEGSDLGLPTLTYVLAAPTLTRPIASGHQFLLAGQPWAWAMMTGFCDYLRFQNNDLGTLAAVLQEAQALGATGRRVLLQMHFITRFYPRDYGSAFYQRLPEFVALENQYGQIPELVVYADEQVINSGRGHFDQVCAAVRGLPCVVELANEYSKNGIDPLAFPQFVDGLTFSRGSDVQEAPIVQPPGDYATFRERRDFWKCIGRGYKAAEACWDFGFNVPFVFNEPLGAAETITRPDRSTDPAVFQALAAQYRAVGAGATFHCEAGLTSLPLGPIQTRCAQAFFRAYLGGL